MFTDWKYGMFFTMLCKLSYVSLKAGCRPVMVTCFSNAQNTASRMEPTFSAKILYLIVVLFPPSSGRDPNTQISAARRVSSRVRSGSPPVPGDTWHVRCHRAACMGNVLHWTCNSFYPRMGHLHCKKNQQRNLLVYIPSHFWHCTMHGARRSGKQGVQVHKGILTLTSC